MPSTKAPVIALSASGGGHFRQLLDLKALWSRYPHFFISEDTVLARSIAKQEEMEFVPHFALGQSRLGKLGTMLRMALTSVTASFRIVWRRRPDIVITTGAGSQIFVVLWARLTGGKVVLIDSFARFRAPSKFARIAGKLAHLRIAQSNECGKNWGSAQVFDPLRMAEATDHAPKEDLLFATVGAILPFDRLCQHIVALKAKGHIPENVILQTGCTEVTYPVIPGLSVVQELPFDQVQEILRRASIVVSHAGTGSLVTALGNGCRTVAIPRRVEHNDSYDNHQVEIAENFAARGLIQMAEDEATLAAALDRARTSVACRVEMDHSELVAFLDNWLSEQFPQSGTTARVLEAQA